MKKWRDSNNFFFLITNKQRNPLKNCLFPTPMKKSPFRKKLSHLFRSLLEIFDMFAVKPSDVLTFKKEFYYSNWFTKTITALIAISAISYLIIQIIDVVGLQNPSINFYETFTSDSTTDSINFGQEGFFVAFALQNSQSNNYSNPGLYFPRLEAINPTLTTTIPLILCDKVTDSKFSGFKRGLPDPSLFYCLGNYSDLMLNGVRDKNFFLNYRLILRPGNNFTEAEANTFIDASTFVMKYTTTQIDLEDIYNPLKETVGDYFHPLDSDSMIDIYFGFTPIYFQNLKSSLLDIHVPTYSKPKLGIVNGYEKFSSKSRQNKSLTTDFFSLNLRMAQVEKQYTRAYLGILVAFSNVGGLFHFVAILSNVFVLNFLRNALIQRVSNEVLDYREYIEMLDQQGKKKKLSGIQTKTKIKLSLWESMKQCLPCFLDSKRKKILEVRKEILKSARKEMKSKYDIANILSRINESEKIQYVLTSEQYRKFTEISKPKICLVRPDSREFKDERQKKFFKSFYIQNDRIIDQIIDANKPAKIVKPLSVSSIHGTMIMENSEKSEKSKFANILKRVSKKDSKDQFNFELGLCKPPEIEFVKKKEAQIEGFDDYVKENSKEEEKTNNNSFFPQKNSSFSLENVREENSGVDEWESRRSIVDQVLKPKKKINYLTVDPESLHERNELTPK